MALTRHELPRGVAYVEVEPPVARLVLDRPEQNNPMSEDWRTDVRAGLDLLAGMTDVAVLIVKSNGRGLSAGGDLNFAMKYFGNDDYEDRQNCLRLGRYLYRAFWQFPKPVVLKIQGFCLGGATAMMATADVVVAEPDAVIGTPETRTLGFEPMLGYWAMTIGPRWTKLLLYSGDLIDARTAHRVGMVTKLVPPEDLDPYVEWLAHRIAASGVETLSIQKEAVNSVFEIAGVEAAARMTMVYNHLNHGSARAREWKRRLLDEGIKEALAWRDAPFGGRTRLSGPFPLLDGPSGPAAE